MVVVVRGGGGEPAAAAAAVRGSSGEPPPPVDWDPSVGAPGCTAAWNGGMSPCDTTPDDYIVIHKSARNLALCSAGSLVSNFQIGISPAPNDVGDKLREVLGDE